MFYRNLLFPIFSIIVLPFFSPPTYSSESLTDIRVQLKWHHQFQFAGFYAALHKGYFRQAGLNVELMPGGPDIDPVRIVTAGEAEFGIGNSSLLLDHQKGLPIVAVAAIFQHSPFILMARRNNQIRTVKDLEHRMLMAETHSAELIAYMILAGVDINTIQFVQHTGRVESLSYSGPYQIDAMTAFLSSEPYEANHAGIAYQIFSPRDIGLDFYGDTLFTTRHIAKQYPEQVTAFRDALLKGWHYAVRHRNEIISLIMEKYPTKLDTFQLNSESLVTLELLARDYIDLGYMSEQRWQSIAESFGKAGLLPDNYQVNDFLFTAKPRTQGILNSLLLAGLLTLCAIVLAIRFYLQKKQSDRQATRLSEEAEQLHRHRQNQMAMAEVATTIAHELNQPLAAINNYAQAAINFNRRQFSNPEKLNDSLYQLIRQAEIASAIVQQSREQLDHQAYPQQTIDLVGTIRDSVHLCLFNARKRNISLIFSPQLCEAFIMGNEIQIKQMLINLITNAVEALDEHAAQSPTVTLTLSEGDQYYQIDVQDNGPGLDSTERVFTTQYTTKEAALGMGLSICRSITEIHLGSISACNSPSGGAIFSIQLPIYHPEAKDHPSVFKQPLPVLKEIS